VLVHSFHKSAHNMLMMVNIIEGGEKYLVNNQLMKFAIDSADIYGGISVSTSCFEIVIEIEGDKNAMKAASKELLSLTQLVECKIPQLRFPLVALLTYCGKRVLVSSLLPIDGYDLMHTTTLTPHDYYHVIIVDIAVVDEESVEFVRFVIKLLYHLCFVEIVMY
jgi:hypothetical protein